MLFRKALLDGTFDKFLLFAHQNFRLFLSHSTAEHVGRTKRESRDFLRNLHDLFLIDHNAVGFFENRLKTWVRIMNRFWLPFSVDVVRNTVHWTRTVKCVQSNQIFKFFRLELTQNFLHTRRFKLENCSRVTPLKKLECLWISFTHICTHKIWFTRLFMTVYNIFRISNQRKCFETKIVEFYKSARLDYVHCILNADLSSLGIHKNRRPVRQFRKSDYHSRSMETCVSLTAFKFYCKIKEFFVFWVVPEFCKLTAIGEFFVRRLKAVFEFCL